MIAVEATDGSGARVRISSMGPTVDPGVGVETTTIGAALKWHLGDGALYGRGGGIGYRLRRH